jgi:hypothetical protein
MVKEGEWACELAEGTLLIQPERFRAFIGCGHDLCFLDGRRANSAGVNEPREGWKK